MKLVVGLGNPGREYKNTRHNIGFMILDNYLGKVNWKTKMESYFYNLKKNNDEIIFIKPLTYMNLSGLSVRKIVDFYKIPISNILIIQDDLDLDVGKFKVKKNSSSGGHNGIKSIISELNTEAFGRLKVGIGKNSRIPIDKYVLSKFTKEELEILNTDFNKYNQIIDLFIDKNIEEVQQKYNSKE